MGLGECAVGEAVRIVHVRLTGRPEYRLRELGLRPGAVVRVTHDAGRQGMVVALGAGRLALDRETCAAILVEALG